MILTHYYHKNDRPFQSLSSLPDTAALSVIESCRDRTGSVYRRFNNPQQYLQHRRETEHWLRAKFIERGGKPNSLYPHYFVVDRSTWIEDGYDGQHEQIQMPLSTFAPELVSFTYPDSMISYWLSRQIHAVEPTLPRQVFYHPEYHGHVFGVTEIYPIIEKFGIPDRQWQTEAERKYDLFIEVQVWDKIEWCEDSRSFPDR
jgi:hypothetical protein